MVLLYTKFDYNISFLTLVYTKFDILFLTLIIVWKLRIMLYRREKKMLLKVGVYFYDVKK
jgi:hypothetical protein